MTLEPTTQSYSNNPVPESLPHGPQNNRNTGISLKSEAESGHSKSTTLLNADVWAEVTESPKEKRSSWPPHR